MSMAPLNPPSPNIIPLPTSMPHPVGGLPYPVGACSFSIHSLYYLYFGIHLVTCTRMTMIYETQSDLSTKEKIRFSTPLRRGSPRSETPVPGSVREVESLQPVKTMKPFCARLSGHWILEKSLFSSCRRDGRKHLFPPPRLLYHLCRGNRLPRGRLRYYRRSNRYGSVPRANSARGGYETSSSMARILKVVSYFLSLIQSDGSHLSQFRPHQFLFFSFHCLQKGLRSVVLILAFVF